MSKTVVKCITVIIKKIERNIYMYNSHNFTKIDNETFNLHIDTDKDYKISTTYRPSSWIWNIIRKEG